MPSELPQIFDSSNSYLNGYPKYVEAEASLSGDTFEYTVPLEFFNNAMGGQYNVDPLSFEIEIGDYNNQNLLDNLTIIDNTIELQEGHYFNADNSDATEGFEIILNDAQGNQVFYSFDNDGNVILANDHRPEIASFTPLAIDENSTANTIIYDFDATDGDANATLIYSLSGVDASYFDINENTGEVTLLVATDFETQPVYNFDVIVSDGKYSDTQSVVLNVNDINEWEITDTNDLRWFDVASGVDIILNQSDYQLLAHLKLMRMVILQVMHRMTLSLQTMSMLYNYRMVIW